MSAETIIHLDGALPLSQLDAHGWTQGDWTDDDGRVCAHQAIRLCAPVPGDAYLIEQVEARRGHGPDWNDRGDTTEAEVREWLAGGIDVTDTDLADTFGPQWRAVVSIVRQAASMTDDQAERLYAAGGAAWDAARGAAWDAARDAAWDAAGDAAWDAAWDAAGVAAVWDLATPDGPFTLAHRDLLMAPWVEVFGLPDGLTETVAP